MFRLVLPATLLLSAPSFAQEPALCPLRADSASCSRVVACVGDQGRFFHGRALGRGSGTIVGVMSDGVSCEGNWRERGPLGFGQASATCTDGTEVSVLFTYQDRYSGTAKGYGQTSTGDKVEVWSGFNVLGYLKEQTGEPLGTLPCTPGGLLLSEAGAISAPI